MPESALYLNHGLATAYINGRSRWMADYDQNEIAHLQVHICPLVCVKKLTKGASTVLRLTQAANSKYRSLCGIACPCKSVGKGERQPGQPINSQDDHDDDDQHRYDNHDENVDAVSYTHLTLPTTPYV